MKKPPHETAPTNRSRASTPTPSADRLRRDWTILCEGIGERRAGSAGERQAAAYIAEQMTAAGLAGVQIEEFSCTSLRSAETTVQVQRGRRWQTAPSWTLVGAPGTPGGKSVDGPLVWLTLPEGAGRLKRGSLRGSIAALFGPLPTLPEHHRALVAAAPAAVIHVDERFPFAWAKSDGVYPYWTKRYGMPTTVTVPYTEAWAWRQAGVNRARVRVALEQVTALSQNVIGLAPGTEPGLPEVLFTSHHDTQCGNPGADDNASGVVCILELARLLAAKPRRRTLRFISFGTEEQLSVGSAAYARQHDPRPDQIGLVLNFDSVSSPLGHYNVSCIGSDTFLRHATRTLARHGIDALFQRTVTPFVDNFPFNYAGIPSLWFHRTNFPGGRWQHHSPHDTLANVSPEVVAKLLGAVAPLARHLAGATRWPFALPLPEEQRREARRLGRELFGLR